MFLASKLESKPKSPVITSDTKPLDENQLPSNSKMPTTENSANIIECTDTTEAVENWRGLGISTSQKKKKLSGERRYIFGCKFEVEIQITRHWY